MATKFSKTLLGAALVAGGTWPAEAATFTPFSFTSNVSTSGLYGGVNGIYGDGDVRLDSVSFGGSTLTTAELQTVNGATILVDDGVDEVRGGHNFASGRGINSVPDTWAPEGPATITPTSDDLYGSLANYNLTSIVVTREAVGTASLEVTFANPTNTFFFWERGSAAVQGNSDILIQSIGANDEVTAGYKIVRGDYTATGIVITTDNGSFTSLNPVLGSIGLQLDEPTSKLRLTSVQQGPGGINDQGPDYKLLASAGVIAPVPIPGAAWLLGSAVLPLVLRRRQRV